MDMKYGLCYKSLLLLISRLLFYASIVIEHFYTIDAFLLSLLIPCIHLKDALNCTSATPRRSLELSVTSTTMVRAPMLGAWAGCAAWSACRRRMKSRSMLRQMWLGFEALSTVIAREGPFVQVHHAYMPPKSVRERKRRWALATLVWLDLFVYTSNLRKETCELQNKDKVNERC